MESYSYARPNGCSPIVGQVPQVTVLLGCKFYDADE